VELPTPLDPVVEDGAGAPRPAATTLEPIPDVAPPDPRRLLLILGALSALGPASLDIYLPGLPSVADEFGTSASTAQLTIALFLLGLGGGQLVAGPLSDTFGRRRPMLAAIVLFAFASTACAAAPSIEVLLASRILQGAAASAGIVIARAVIRDLFRGSLGARMLSRLVLIYGLAPVLAPALGAQVLRVTSWRGVFAVLVMGAAVLLVATARTLPETLPPERRRPGSVGATRRSFARLLRHRVFLGYALTLGFGSGATIGYVSGSPFLLQDIYGVSPQVFGLFFGANAVAMIGASQLNAHLVTRIPPRRLLVAAVGALIGVGAVLLGAVLADLGLWVVALCLLALMCTWGFIPPNAIALAMRDHPEIAGTASALTGVFQYGMGAISAPIVGAGGMTSALPMAVTMLVSGLLSATAIHWFARDPVAA
jgi:DHA1 family bicyclomycin/chloramphenicol resistance-like MFS transporter